MKRIVLVLLFLLPTVVRGFDFAATVSSGQTLYFNIVDGGVQVVYPNTSANPWGSYQRPSGALTIPAAVVSPSGVEYAVVSVGTKALYATYITSLLMEEGVQSVGGNAFGANESLATVRLPASLVTLQGAFVMCGALSDVYMSGSMPPASTSVGAFSQSPVGTATLHVPCGSEGNYVGSPWDAFGSVDAGVCSVTITTAVSGVERGGVSGGGTYPTGTAVVLTATAAEGYVFVCWADADTLNPRIVDAVRDSHFTAVFQRPVHDTVEVQVVEVQRDTLYLRDTVVLRVVDTLYLRDTLYFRDTVTVQPTFFRLQVTAQDVACGIGIGTAFLPAGTEAEIGALPLEGHRFMCWGDGSEENPRRVSVQGDASYVAVFERVAIEEADASGWSFSVEGRMLSVRCRGGERVEVYDAGGRVVASCSAGAETTRVVLPSPGVYVVRVGRSAGRKVTVR